MKLPLLLLFFTLGLFANGWNLKNIMLTTENDADFRTDRDYTYGSEISVLFKKKRDDYISFSIAHQMFTPKDFNKEDVDFSKERPYAGYMYLGMGLHGVTKNILESFNFQLGFVGPSTKMDRVQKIIHDIIGSPEPTGWDDQIKDELILQINYERRWYFDIDERSSIIYYAGGNFGNASIKAVTGAFYRYGWNIQKNFAPKRIDYRGYPNIPLEGYTPYKTTYAFSFDLWIEGSVVGKDIFLDGNTFKESVSVAKKIFVAKGGFGVSYRYENFFIDYIKTFSTKEFTTQSYYHSYGSLIFSYNF